MIAPVPDDNLLSRLHASIQQILRSLIITWRGVVYVWVYWCSLWCHNNMEGMHSSYFWQLGASEESLGKQMRKLYNVHCRSVIRRERERERISNFSSVLEFPAGCRFSQTINNKGSGGLNYNLRFNISVSVVS